MTKKRKKFKSMKVALPLQPRDISQISPRQHDVVINIRRRGSVYTVDMLAPEMQASTIEWTPDDIASRISDISDSLRTIVHGGEDARQALADLKRDGLNAFREIFKNARMREVIRETCTQSVAPSIAVNSPDFFYPWETLYLAERISGDREFLGLHANVTRTITRDGVPYVHAREPLRNSNSDFLIAVGWCDQLSAAVDREVPFLLGLPASLSRGTAGSRRHATYQIAALEGNEPQEENARALFSEIGDTGAPILHLACHAENGPTDRNRRFRLRRGAIVNHSAIKALGEKTLLKHRPVIFFNACDASVSDPMYQASFAELYLDLGARAFLAPQCKIADNFAFEFAKIFYGQFVLRGEAFGDALLASRRIASRDGNVASLAYALYGQSDAKLAF